MGVHGPARAAVSLTRGSVSKRCPSRAAPTGCKPAGGGGHNLPSRRAGCEQHLSGSVRGAPRQRGAPTRLALLNETAQSAVAPDPILQPIPLAVPRSAAADPAPCSHPPPCARCRGAPASNLFAGRIRCPCWPRGGVGAHLTLFPCRREAGFGQCHVTRVLRVPAASATDRREYRRRCPREGPGRGLGRGVPAGPSARVKFPLV